MKAFENLMDMKKVNDLLDKKDQELGKLYRILGKKEIVKEQEEEKEEKKVNTLVWIFAIIGVIVAVACICYVAYRYFKPDYLDDFDDDFDEEFDDDADTAKSDDSFYEDEE